MSHRCTTTTSYVRRAAAAGAGTEATTLFELFIEIDIDVGGGSS